MGSYEQTMVRLEKMAGANTAKQFKWQEKMSNTSHQREVKDLVQAGLNPVLSSGGSGAQAYTTSVDSAVNGIANMASAREGANATRYAAQQSAAATRAAAAANLAAAREAAAASRYHTDMSYKAALYKADMDYKTAIDKPVSSIGGAIDKFANKSGLYDALGTKTVQGAVRNLVSFLNDPLKMFRKPDHGKITQNNFEFTRQGYKQVNLALGKLGIKQTDHTRNLAIRGFVFGSPVAISQLKAYIPKQTTSKSVHKTRANKYTVKTVDNRSTGSFRNKPVPKSYHY